MVAVVNPRRLLILAVLVALGCVMFSATAARAGMTSEVYVAPTSNAGGFDSDSGPNSMALDPSGNVYIMGEINGSQNAIYKVVPNGSLPAPVEVAVDLNQLGVNMMFAITFDAAGNLYVLYANKTVYELPAGSPPGTALVNYADLNSIPGSLGGFAAVGTTLFIDDCDSGTVYSFAAGETSNLPLAPTSFATGLGTQIGGLAAAGTDLLVVNTSGAWGGSGIGLFRLDTTGGPIANPTQWADLSGLSGVHPWSVGVDVTGDIYISSSQSYLSSNVTGLYKIPAGSTAGELVMENISGPQTDPSSGWIWVATVLPSPLGVLVFGSDQNFVHNVYKVYDLVPPTTTTTAGPTTTSPATTTTAASSGMAVTGSPLGMVGGLGLLLVGGGLLVRRRMAS